MKKFMILLFAFMFVFASCATSTDAPQPTDPVESEEPVVESEEPAEEESQEAEEPATGEKTKLTFAVQADSTPALDEIIKAFNEKSEQYEVEAFVMTNDSGQMYDQLLNSLSSKSAEYDIISMDVVWAGTFAAGGYLEPIDEILMNNGWTVADFNAGSMDSGKYQGKNFVMPYFPDLGFLYVRSDIVSPEDLAKLQSGDYTWEEFYAMNEKYAGEGGTNTGFAFQANQYEGLTVNANEFTGNWTNNQAGLEMMKQFVDSDLTPEDILAYDEGATANAFLNGEVVFARNWPYVNGMIQSGEHTVKSEQVQFAPLPEGGSVGGWILGLNANGANLEGAKEFLTFIAGPEGQKINATVGSYIPGFNALLEDQEVLDANALLTNEGFQNALANTIARPVVADYAKVSDNIQIAVHSYLSGNGTVEEAVGAIEAATAE